MHIEPIEILSYRLITEDGTCVDTNDKLDTWISTASNSPDG